MYFQQPVHACTLADPILACAVTLHFQSISLKEAQFKKRCYAFKISLDVNIKCVFSKI